MGQQDYRQVFAVIRLDLFSLAVEPELSVKVVEILPDEHTAAEEATRLNGLNAKKNVTYFVQSTHWYEHGRPLAADQSDRLQ